MARNVPEESFVVAWKNGEGRLHIYADTEDIERFGDYTSAQSMADRLNSRPNLRPSEDMARWEVYRMKFEKAIGASVGGQVPSS